MGKKRPTESGSIRTKKEPADRKTRQRRDGFLSGGQTKKTRNCKGSTRVVCDVKKRDGLKCETLGWVKGGEGHQYPPVALHSRTTDHPSRFKTRKNRGGGCKKKKPQERNIINVSTTKLSSYTRGEGGAAENTPPSPAGGLNIGAVVSLILGARGWGGGPRELATKPSCSTGKGKKETNSDRGVSKYNREKK